MKKFSILFLTFIALIGLNACSSHDDVVFVAQPDEEGISFTNSFASVYELSDNNRENLAERFVWDDVDFDAPTTITYELQGSPDADFNEFDVLGNTGSNNLSVTVGEMLSLAEDAGLDNDPETEAPNTGEIYFRVRAYAGDGEANALEEISEIVGLTVELPEADEDDEGEVDTKREFYLVGDATAAGWDPNNNNTPLFRDAENENIFYFDGRFAGGSEVEGFKLIENLDAWQPQWGLSEGNLTNSTILGTDPDAFPVDADAFYSFAVNTEEMTYSFEEIDASEGATYETMGLVGEGTSGGWPSDDNPTPDLELINSTFNEHIWYANDVTLTEAPIKFRADKAWDVDWGTETFPAGQGTIGGSDIPATAGTYDVWFNDLTGRYLFIPSAE